VFFIEQLSSISGIDPIMSAIDSTTEVHGFAFPSSIAIDPTIAPEKLWRAYCFSIQISCLIWYLGHQYMTSFFDKISGKNYLSELWIASQTCLPIDIFSMQFAPIRKRDNKIDHLEISNFASTWILRVDFQPLFQQALCTKKSFKKCLATKDQILPDLKGLVVLLPLVSEKAESKSILKGKFHSPQEISLLFLETL